MLVRLTIHHNKKNDDQLAIIMSRLDSAYTLIDSFSNIDAVGLQPYTGEGNYYLKDKVKSVNKPARPDYMVEVDDNLYVAGVLFLTDAKWERMFPNNWEEAKAYAYSKVESYLRSVKYGAHYGEKKYKIPRYITYAQSLYESNGGESRMAREINNHGGIKCHDPNHKGKEETEHCKRYNDDSPLDMFRKFDSTTDCIKYRSDFVLQKTWYKDCYEHKYKLNSDNALKHWAHHLQDSDEPNEKQYATSKTYSSKIYKLAVLIKKQYPNL